MNDVFIAAGADDEASSVPLQGKLPFVLKCSDHTGTACGLCPVTSACQGCVVCITLLDYVDTSATCLLWEAIS